MAEFLKAYDIYFLIVGNPDGYEYSHKVLISIYFVDFRQHSFNTFFLKKDLMWRKNMRGYRPIINNSIKIVARVLISVVWLSKLNIFFNLRMFWSRFEP